MVGALADWFAVTALFRHPLGIPIPHTAIIPRRKDQIGRSLGEFVEQNFLTHDVLGERLADARIGRARHVAGATRRTPARAADGVADALRGTLEVLDDDEVQAGLERVVERGSARCRRHRCSAGRSTSPSRVVTTSACSTPCSSASAGSSRTTATTFRERLEKESPWWVPEPIDDRIFKKIYAARRQLHRRRRRRPRSRGARTRIDARVRDFADRLRTIPSLLAKGEELKDELLAHPDVRAWLASLWRELEAGDDRRAGDDPTASCGVRMTSSAAQPRRAAARSTPSCSTRSTTGSMRAVGYVVDHYRNEVSDLIAGTVERWDADDDVAQDGAAGRARPPVHPHQRHDRRRARRASADPRRRQRDSGEPASGLGVSARRRRWSSSNSSTVISTSRALEPSLGPTTPRCSSRSMIRPARAKPTFSLRCSIDVEPSWLRTTSSIAWRIITVSSSSSPDEKALSRRRHHAVVAAAAPRATLDVVDVADVGRLAAPVGDDLADLFLADERALDALGDRRVAGQQQHVALADELLGAGLVEDHPRVGEARDGERHAGRDVGLDHTGDDVHRRTLRGDDQVDADRPRLLGDAGDRLLDVAGGHHHQVVELVDDDHDVRQVLVLRRR